MDSHWDSTTWTRYESAIDKTTRPKFPPLQPTYLSVYIVLFIIGAYVVVQRLDYYPLLPLQQLLWNVFVYVLPPSLVMALDKQQPTTQADMISLSSYSSARTFAAKNEAVRRILRMNGPIAATGFGRPRAFSGIGSLMKGPSPLPIAGLGNWDNSCYQNSVIQGLASLPSVADFLQQDDVEKTRDDAETSTRTALKDIIEQLNDQENAGKRLWTPAALKSMSSWQQQDAQEYYSKILDDVEKDIASSIRRTRTHEGLRMAKFLSQREPSQALREGGNVHNQHILQAVAQTTEEAANDEEHEAFNPLEGLLAQRVGCLQCGYAEGLSMVPFNCLTLPLSKTFANNIEDCLDEFTQLERIEGVECGKCTLLRQEQYLRDFLQKTRTPDLEPLFADVERRLETVKQSLAEADFSENTITKKCQIPGKQRVSSTKTKQAVVVREPESLVLHINRSVFDEMTGMLSKNTSHVGFPQILDLGCWSIGSSRGLEEKWSVDPHVSLLAGDIDNASDTSLLNPAKNYILRAIITHYGRHENGHYICYRRDPDDSTKWWRLSDDDVSSVSQEQVLAQGGVFMLFYTRMQNAKQHRAPQASVAIDQWTNEKICPASSQAKDEAISIAVSSSISSDVKEFSKALPQIAIRQEVERKPTEEQLNSQEQEETTTSINSKDSKDILSSDFRSTGSLVPTMRTASITKNRARKGTRPGAGPGLSSMVAAN